MLFVVKFLEFVVHLVYLPITLLCKLFKVDPTGDPTSHKYRDYLDHIGDKK